MATRITKKAATFNVKKGITANTTVRETPVETFKKPSGAGPRGVFPADIQNLKIKKATKVF